MKSAQRRNKRGFFKNNTLSFYTSILFVHITAIFISTDGNSISFATTQQDCKEEKCSKKSCGFLSFIVNNLLISSPQRGTRQAKEQLFLWRGGGRYGGTNWQSSKVVEKLNFPGQVIKQEKKLLYYCSKLKLIQNMSYSRSAL